MSYELLGRATMATMKDLSNTEVSVLMFLCGFANSKTGQCNPSQSTLADRARLTRRATINILNRLEEKGYISRTRNFRQDGSETSCSYIINLEKLPAQHVASVALGVNDVHTPSEPRSQAVGTTFTHPVNDVHTNQLLEPVIEQEKREVAVAPATTKPAKVRFDPLSIELPKAVDREAWHDWVEYKRSTKKPIASQAVATKTANLLARHPPECQQAMVNYSIVGGYPGLYEEQAGKLNGQDRRTEHQKRTDAITEATWGSKANDW